MKINLNDHLKVNTCYTFELIRDGKCIQKEKTHNILCKNFFNIAPAARDGGGGLAGCTLAIGSGAGTPADTDTALFNLLWNTYFRKDSIDVTYGEKTESAAAFVKSTLTYTIPATTTYVGNITECGLQSAGSPAGLYTHAMLLDAEGNPITIEKTDLDILVVHVEITVNCVETDTVKFVPMGDSPLYKFMSRETSSLNNWLYPRVAVLWSVEECLSAGLFASAWQTSYYPIYYTPANATFLNHASATHKDRTITINGARLGSTFPDNEQLFIRGLLVSNFFIIPFPNAEVFPTYTIPNIDVGVGDGVTTEFTCPLNYFVKNTDKVYINGVLKTRGVDYTLDNENNNQAVTTLMAANEAIITGGISAADSGRVYAPVFRSVKHGAKVSGYSNYGFYVAYNNMHYPYAFSTTAPLFFDMKKDVRVNYLHIGKSNPGSTSYGGIKYTVWYLNENDEWVECGSVIKNDSATAVYATFDEVTARHFKVTVEYVSNTATVTTSNVYAYSGDYSCSNTADGSSSPILPESLCMFGYKGKGIVFTNPPAEGDIITMEADLDLPMKNGNFVFDVDLTLTY